MVLRTWVIILIVLIIVCVIFEIILKLMLAARLKEMEGLGSITVIKQPQKDNKQCTWE